MSNEKFITTSQQVVSLINFTTILHAWVTMKNVLIIKMGTTVMMVLAKVIMW